MLSSLLRRLLPSSSSSSPNSYALNSDSHGIGGGVDTPLVREKVEEDEADHGYYMSHPITDWVEYEGDIKLEEESYFLLAFMSWLHGTTIDRSKWTLRAGQKGLLALFAAIFLFGQLLTLFDLAYEENLAAYKCLGNSARLSVATCSVLVTLIVAVKMQPEERRCFALRLVLIRHSTAYSFWTILQGLFSGDNVGYWFKILYLYIFRNFREYGVVVFVYVGAMEQTMLFESILQYIINCTVVLLVAELDELLFISLAKSDLSPSSEGESSRSESLNDATSIEQGSSTMQSNNTAHEPYERSNTMTSRAARVNHVISNFTHLRLSPKEQEAFNYWDFFIVRCNFLSMIIPLMSGKLSGRGCSENSWIRVSEVGMLCLMLTRVLLNVQVDMLIDRRFSCTLSGLTRYISIFNPNPLTSLTLTIKGKQDGQCWSMAFQRTFTLS